ncbi:oligoribonuclease [Legionella cardiaca]|uniref:Oligoribonuclease n=1 Tax=Legionella cardiaca TaxID=1071983 RepID=A0ABY8ARW9_9GAMM|nr:oligoribonuclease [Legionella cardiaca]WED42511.1 oligoribonuclease [Legionella cardiaca]
MKKNNDNLIWIDLEMTGLEPEKDHIIEIATIVTDAQLNILAEGPVFAIHQNETLLMGMDEWNTKQHNQSGLVKRVRESTINEAEAERQTIDFLKNYLDRGKSPMCGNSICQDRRFLYKYMPELAAYFHYRNLDVSTLKELVKRWRPKLLNGVIKESKHLALDDIKDSIAELAYYRQHFINIADT